MKFIKRIVIGIAALLGLLLIVALFVKKEFAIVRQTEIHRPITTVFHYIKYIKNQDNFSVWNALDPNMEKKFTGTDGSEGFVYAWQGNKNAGSGEQEIIRIVDNERIDVELRFKKPMQVTNQAAIITTKLDSNTTKVEWIIHGKSVYPFNLMNLCMDDLIGKDLQQNLYNLKQLLEK